MSISISPGRPHEVRELKKQISALEDRFVELFAGEGNRELLKRIHVQLKVLKVELRLQEGCHIKAV